MLVEFKVANFRSIRSEQVFTMAAESGRNKSDNTFSLTLADGSEERLLRSAVIYGANASGKSTFILAFLVFRYFVSESSKFKVDKPINCYEPFLLDVDFENAPVEFEITFINKEKIKYRYGIKFNRNYVLYEQLDFYPNGKITNLFKRSSESEDYDTLSLGKSLKDKNISRKVFKNQLYLSRFGFSEPHDQLTPIYRYLNELNIWNASNKIRLDSLRKDISKLILEPNNQIFAKKLSKLIKVADTKIENVSVKVALENEFEFPDFLPEDLKKQFIEDNSIKAFATHTLYKEKNEIGIRELPFDEESQGTNVLFALGGLILQTLDKGGVIIVDELDNSLHPKLSKFLVRLFNSPITNKWNAQLIFASHEVTLLDKDNLRKDQIWFTSKDKFGETELFSAKDFEGVRDDTPFDKWYNSGKFGGDPKIKEVEFIFGND
ncbi:ATP/GTP-binding protein [Nibrella saemangeumensis]|uniref:ATP/GTP-binding protein n=1 Tax=Nibrella saemangeumensis TaxID=1084526 RepID=A0ABP8NFG7_9BACT